MIDFSRIVGFDWDDGNSSKSLDKHGVGAAEAEEVFAGDPLLIVEDVRHSRSEPRYHALGQTAVGRRLHVTFTLRAQGTRIRILSARDMSRKERSAYEQENQANSSLPNRG
jgi:uncharacterized DUF497 family protein